MKKSKIFKNLKNAYFVKKIAKICDIQPLMRFSGPWDSNNLNNDNKCQKLFKKLQGLQKMIIFMMAESSQPSIITINYAVIYHQTLYQTNDKNFQKPEKNCKNLSFCVFVFVVPKHIALKMAITSNFVSQKAFINF